MIIIFLNIIIKRTNTTFSYNSINFTWFIFINFYNSSTTIRYISNIETIRFLKFFIVKFTVYNTTIYNIKFSISFLTNTIIVNSFFTTMNMIFYCISIRNVI